ncbi:MAG: sugar ABC transporter permease, partial [Massilia sp.]
MLRNRRSEYLVALVLVAPFLLIFGWMFIYPTIQMVQVSFTKSPLIGAGVWVGLH